jgi:hypothetical protein
MDEYTKQDMEKALRAITSMINRCEKSQVKFVQGTSQYTLQKNRIKALNVALSLIKKESSENDITDYIKEDLEEAVNPIASLISKSEKSQKKLKQGTWQHAILESNLESLYLASLLLTKALQEG